MLAAYIGLSRVRRKEALLIAEPFSPALFCHGQPPGPEILMKVLRREIAADDSKKDKCCSLCLRVSLCCYLHLCVPLSQSHHMYLCCFVELLKREREKAGLGRAHQEAERRGRGEELQKDEVAVQELHAFRRSEPQPEF